jgi:TolB-like protein
MSNPPASPSGFSRFFAELKRRHVVRFALGYAAVAFVLLQLAEIIFPAFGLGDTKLRILVVAVALLFPPALVLAWVFDITSHGIERTPSAGPPDALPAALLPRLALLGVTVAVVGSLGLWLVREGVLDVPVDDGERAGLEEVALAAYDPEAPIRSLAVLPLDDFSGDGEQEYFTAGLQEELIAQLSQIGGLRVVSRTSVQRYAGGEVSIPRIGRDLRVDGVIEGSVRRSGDQVRITLQLIHAASDTHVWTQQYDRSLDNVLALQSDVALDIARQIRADLTPEETTFLQQVASRSVEPSAQDAYLRGRWEAEKGTPEGLAAAKELLETAVQEDSSFAPALVKLAGTRLLLGLANTTHQDEEFAKAMEEARKAVAMDSTSQEAWDVIRLVAERLPDPAEARSVRAGISHDAVERRDRGLFLLQNDPVWDTVRADPRFTDLVRRSRSPQMRWTPQRPPAGF